MPPLEPRLSVVPLIIRAVEPPTIADALAVVMFLAETHVCVTGDDPAIQCLEFLGRLLRVFGGGVGIVHAGDRGADVQSDNVRSLFGQTQRMAGP